VNECLCIRPVTLKDVPKLTAVHAGSDGPWVDLVECAIWVNHRLGRPFMIDVAELDRVVVGHAEWILSDEPGFLGRQLYLVMLQIHPRYRGRGIGRAMVQHGYERARRLSCQWMRTLAEEGSEGFYQRCGFRPGARVVEYAMPVYDADLPAGWQRVKSVPERIVHAAPMRLGWVSACSAFMWETCNRPAQVAGERVCHPCVRCMDGDADAYVQLRHWDAAEEALALAWGQGAQAVQAYLAVAMALAQGGAINTLSVVLPETEAKEITELGRLVSTELVWELAVTAHFRP
jgi:GNAT superfamily N-acetyltransferase